MFLVVSRSDMQFGFEHPFFCVPDRAHPKNRCTELTDIGIYCVKSVQIRNYFWLVFSCIRTRNNSVFGHFSWSNLLLITTLEFSNTARLYLSHICVKLISKWFKLRKLEYPEEPRFFFHLPKLTDCIFLPCHVRVSEWIHTL